jgi:hypothetical protein
MCFFNLGSAAWTLKGTSLNLKAHYGKQNNDNQRMSRTNALLASLLVGLTVALCAASCGQPKLKGTAEPRVRNVFLHGDPRVLIAGASLNPQTFLNKANLESFSDLDFAGGIVFSEFSPLHGGKEAPTRESIERNNATSYQPTEIASFSFVEGEQAGVAVYILKDANSQQEMLRAIPSEDGRVWVYEMLGFPVELLHYSRSPNGSSISFLGYAKIAAESGKTLLSLSFSKKSPGGTGARETDPRFQYIAGPGIAFEWKVEQIELSVCIADNRPQNTAGSPAELQLAIGAAWKTWQNSGRIGRKPAVFRVLNHDYPPFSDVNTHCVYSIPEYAHESSLEFVTTGLTIPITNRTDGSFISSDIFLFEQAISRVSTDRGYLGTAMHELGHFLGLGHEFSRNSDGTYAYPSVMGYLENRTKEPSNHDRAAIENLYGPVQIKN